MVTGDTMVGILLDSEYRKSLWCKSLYESLVQSLRRKRIPFCDITQTVDHTLDAIFIIASDREWCLSAVTQLNQNGITPILICNQSENLPGCIYSCVCSDIHASMKNLLDTLRSKGRNRLALYGINTDSLADISRVDSLFHWREPDLQTMQIFNNHGSLQNCFARFFDRIDEFDAAICANDFAAVSLVRNLENRAPEKLDDIYIVSCAQTQISHIYRHRIVSLNMNFDQYGEAAVYVYHTLKKHPYLSGMTARVLWSLDSNLTAPPLSSVILELEPGEDAFYNDRELAEMLIVDKVLNAADDMEKTILKSLWQKQTVEQIAERCFMTVSGVKYRVRKLLTECGAQSKDELVSLLGQYVYRNEP